MTRDRGTRGIETLADGRYRVRVWVHGQEYVHRFAGDTTLETMQAWRRHTRADAERDLLPKHDPGTFAADADVYLAAVKAMPTYKERVRDIQLWVEEFGARPRDSITSVEIRAVRDRWATVGPRLEQRWVADPGTGRKVQTFVPVTAPLSPSAVNHRLRALESFFTVTLGRHAPNPVRDVPELDEGELPPRTVPLPLIKRILAVMPASQAKARLSVLAWTGIPPASLKQITLEMVDWDAPAVWVPKRRKGKGAAGRWLPLSKAGVKAFKLLKREDAFGPHSWDNVRRAFRSACRRLDVTGLRPYDLRHAIAARTLAATKDFATTGELLLHASPKTTMRYSKAAVAPHLAAAVARLEAAERGESRGRTGQRTGQRRKSARKRR
jgi:integrase